MSLVLSTFSLSLSLGCAGPRVVEVSSRTRLQNVDAADLRLFVRDHASRIRYEPLDLPPEDRREEFFVSWRPRSVGLVKFEYRQVDVPNAVKEQTYVPIAVSHPELAEGSPASTENQEIPRQSTSAEATADKPRNDNSPEPTSRASSGGRSWHVFEIRGEEFHAGGPVSAWRVSLWDGETLLAEKKSALW